MVEISAATLFETIVVVSTRIVPFVRGSNSERVEWTGEKDKNKNEGWRASTCFTCIIANGKEYSTVQCSVSRLLGQMIGLERTDLADGILFQHLQPSLSFSYSIPGIWALFILLYLMIHAVNTKVFIYFDVVSSMPIKYDKVKTLLLLWFDLILWYPRAQP